MLSHEYVDMPAQDQENVLRCRWCMRTPTQARQDGCPIRELEDRGQIVLSEYNPQGVAYFKDRTCVTCERPIMGHWLRKGSDAYWCDASCSQESMGVNGCVVDVTDIAVPVEHTGSVN